VESAEDAGGQELYRWQPSEAVEKLPIDASILSAIKDAMVGVVAEPGGTAHAQSVLKVTMGGKTGTAQVVQLDTAASCSGDICKDHAWFIGFSPADKPKIAAAVVVEHGGFGASAAAPIVGQMMQKFHEIEENL